MHQLLGEAGRRVEAGRACRHVPARSPVSSSSSRGAARSGSSIVPSAATSSVPAGISSRTRPAARRNWRTSRTRSSASMATIATAPGWPAMSRVGARAVGALDRVDPERQVATVVEDPRVDDALDEIGPGGSSGAVEVRSGRSSARPPASGGVRPPVGRPPPTRDAGARRRRGPAPRQPVSPSNRWSFVERQDEVDDVARAGRDARSRRSRRCPCRRR